MHHVDFCYWLQGYVELGGGPPTEQQWQMIKDHLAEVFRKVTPKPWTDGQVEKKVEAPAPAVPPSKVQDEWVKDILDKAQRSDKPNIPTYPYDPFPKPVYYPNYPSNEPWLKTYDLICQKGSEMISPASLSKGPTC